MANFNLPSPPDSADYWGFTPQKETLYGSDFLPRRFIRVIDELPGDSSRVIHTYQDDPQDPSSIVSVESVGADTFIEWLTYGYTPYLEAAICGLKGAIGLEEHKKLFLSQAAYRNYEQRARCLLDIIEEKKYSISTMMGSDKISSAKQELLGVLCMWEMLMNTGDIRPLNCLSYCSAESTTMRYMRSKFLELEDRCLMSNFAPLPFKISDDTRKQLVGAFH